MGLIWVFTDLIKCFVWHGADKENGLYGIKNWGKAIIYCGKYLEEQIRLLQPRKIIGLGGTVAQNFGLDKPEHGSIHSIRINSVYVHSIFPAQWTADLWVAKNGWEPVIQKLVE
jgi:uracil-DNA glycosylase